MNHVMVYIHNIPITNNYSVDFERFAISEHLQVVESRVNCKRGNI